MDELLDDDPASLDELDPFELLDPALSEDVEELDDEESPSEELDELDDEAEDVEELFEPRESFR